jgi:butyryl-CoA dehydrogenase
MLDYVVDEGVQIHGGYGYHQDYAVERAYRDSRINRIFEGSNEINRLLLTGMLLKRAQQGRLGLVQAAKALMAEVMSGPGSGSDLVANAKRVALFLLAIAFEKFGTAMDKQQEVVADISDVIMETFAMESVQLRSQKNSIGADICSVFLADAMGRIEMSARPVIAACSEGDALRMNMTILRRFTKFEPVDSIALRRRIAARVLDAGKYAV